LDAAHRDERWCGACARATTRAAAASKSSLDTKRQSRPTRSPRASRCNAQSPKPCSLSTSPTVRQFFALLRRAAPRAIAARLATPVETVRTRLKRGLAQLRAELDRK